MKDIIKKIELSTEVAQKLIKHLYESDPNNITFNQLGLLDGQDIVMDFIEAGEWGCALDHLLYMIHESDIPFPRETMFELHKIAELHNMGNHYSKANQKNLTSEQLAAIFNAP